MASGAENGYVRQRDGQRTDGSVSTATDRWRPPRRVVAEFARHRPPSGDDATLGSLTERERAVLDHLAAGASNAEIARSMVLGEVTIKTYVSNVLAKLGLRERVQAVVYAYEHGLVTPGES